MHMAVHILKMLQSHQCALQPFAYGMLLRREYNGMIPKAPHTHLACVLGAEPEVVPIDASLPAMPCTSGHYTPAQGCLSGAGFLIKQETHSVGSLASTAAARTPSLAQHKVDRTPLDLHCTLSESLQRQTVCIIKLIMVTVH